MEQKRVHGRYHDRVCQGVLRGEFDEPAGVKMWHHDQCARTAEHDKDLSGKPCHMGTGNREHGDLAILQLEDHPVMQNGVNHAEMGDLRPFWPAGCA